MNLNKKSVIDIIEKHTIYFGGCITAILIFFQANFSYKQFNVNINLADIFAIASACIIAIEIKKLKTIDLLVPKFKTFILLTTLSFCFAITNSLIRYNFSSYNFVSKFLGLFILFGYLGIGALFKLNTNDDDQNILYKILITAAIVIIFIKSLLILIYLSHIFKKFKITAILSGYTNNRNAFALQLLCVGTISIFYLPRHNWITAIIFTGIIFTYSRTAQITLIALCLFLYALKITSSQNIRSIASKVAILSLFFYLLQILFFSVPLLFSNTKQDIPINDNVSQLVNTFHNVHDFYSYPSSDNQRYYTWSEATNLWLKQPFVGIGLGGFVKHIQDKDNIFLVVHNTFLWILSEFGLIGASVFIWYGLFIIYYLYNKSKNKSLRYWSNDYKCLLSIIPIFILMGNAHEIFYQRILWLILGLLIIPTNSTDRVKQ